MSEDLVERFARERASAILRTSLAQAAGPAMDAAVRGGFRIVEFTLTTPGALERIEEFSRNPDLLVGAGTVLDVESARAAVRAGARFLVSPVVDEDVIETARTLDVLPVPGAHTPTELLRAHAAGAPLQKLFPAPAGGPSYVRALLGPLPFLRIVPTSGVDRSNAAEYLAAGAWCVGFVSTLFDPADLREGHFERVERRARELLSSVRAAGPPAG